MPPLSASSIFGGAAKEAPADSNAKDTSTATAARRSEGAVREGAAAAPAAAPSAVAPAAPPADATEEKQESRGRWV
jgi:hypothetical protein